MDEKERVALIRRGNELFNGGKIDEAEKIFIATSYRDGLTRIGDYYYFDKKLPLNAVKYYQLASRKDRMDEIFARMVWALSNWMSDEKNAVSREVAPATVEVKVSPKLKILAEEIIRDNAAV